MANLWGSGWHSPVHVPRNLLITLKMQIIKLLHKVVSHLRVLEGNTSIYLNLFYKR